MRGRMQALGGPTSRSAENSVLSVRHKLLLKQGGRLVTHARRSHVIISAPSSPATPGARSIRATTETAWSGSDLGQAPRMRWCDDVDEEPRMEDPDARK